MISAIFGVGVFAFHFGAEDVFFAVALVAVGGLIVVVAADVAKVNAVRVGPEGGVDDFDVFLADLLGVVAVFFVETFLKGIIDSVGGDFALLIALHSVYSLLL